MQLWQLTLKEALHRKINFISGLLSVSVAVGCVAGALALLHAHDARTEAVILSKEKETREAMLRLENDYRRIMRDMGYNVLVLHEEQDVAALHAAGVPDRYMPESYGEKLAEGGISTLNHLLPVLQQKTWWEGQGIEVLVSGIKGQIPIAHRQRSGPVGPDGSPIMEPVPQGQVDVGYAVASRFGLDKGDAILFNGAELLVNRCFPRRGTQEDMTIWVHLAQAQEWFDKPGLINGILALECICEVDALGRIVAEVRGILPDVQVFEFGTLVRTRALARERAAEAHREAVDSERRNRMVMRQEREKLAALLAPVTVLGAAIWIMLLTYANVRERRTEIGILRALGYDGRRIIDLFQLRTLMMSSMGACLGYVVGVCVGAMLGGAPEWGPVMGQSFSLWRVVTALAGAILLSAVAAWVPARKAAEEDPAEILREVV